MHAKWFKCAGECFLQNEFCRLVEMDRFAAILISLCFWKLTAGKRKLCFALLLDVLKSIPAFSSISTKKSSYIKKSHESEIFMKTHRPNSLTESLDTERYCWFVKCLWFPRMHFRKSKWWYLPVFVTSVRYSILTLRAHPTYEFKDECLVIVYVIYLYVISDYTIYLLLNILSSHCQVWRIQWSLHVI